MKTKDYTKETGRFKTFHLHEEIPTLVKLSDGKPSKLVIKTKKGKKAIAALKDIETNHNHSWYTELRLRASKNPDALALFYRGNKITFREMFEKANKVAKSMVAMGIEKGDEIPACLSNTPELVYILLAANRIGAKINLMGTNLDEDYMNEILDGCSDKLFLCTDDNYGKIKHIIEEREFKHQVMISLSDSAPQYPTECEEYEPELDTYYYFPNLTYSYRFDSHGNMILRFEEMLRIGEKKDVRVKDDNNLDTDFLITYTSGSTKIGRPKQIIHNNRSLMVCGIFHDSKLSGNPELVGLRGLAHIHSDSNTNVITCISDNLMQLWSVALEPEYDKDKALDYVMLNKPNYLNATTSFYIQMAKDYLVNRRFHQDGIGRKLDFLFAAFAVGEPTSLGEEKFINRFLRTARAGSSVKVSGMSLPFTTLSVGGGDCEHGGIYYSLWRSLYEKLNYFKLSKHSYGLMPVPYAQVSAFRKREDGLYEELNFNEYGLIAANSATTMQGYKNNPEATSNMIITDTNGRDWVSSNVLGYIDELGGVHVKGRIDNEMLMRNGQAISPFMIEDIVARDTKNILSCTVTKAMENNEIVPVINIEFQPFKKTPDNKVLESIKNRIRTEYPYLADKIVFRIFTLEQGFPLTGSGKRSFATLEQMGLQDTFRLINGMIYPVRLEDLTKSKVLKLEEVKKQ